MKSLLQFRWQARLWLYDEKPRKFRDKWQEATWLYILSKYCRKKRIVRCRLFYFIHTMLPKNWGLRIKEKVSNQNRGISIVRGVVELKLTVNICKGVWRIYTIILQRSSLLFVSFGFSPRLPERDSHSPSQITAYLKHCSSSLLLLIRSYSQR